MESLIYNWDNYIFPFLVVIFAILGLFNLIRWAVRLEIERYFGK